MEKVPRPPRIIEGFATVKFLILEHDNDHYIRWGPAENEAYCISMMNHHSIRNAFIDELIKAGLKMEGLVDIVGGIIFLEKKEMTYFEDCPQYPAADFDQLKALVHSKHQDYHVIKAEIGPKQDR